MMKFRSNIFFSFVIHMTVFTAALALAGKDAMLRIPERFTMVKLFDAPRVQQTAATGTEKKKRPVIGKPEIGLREAVPPEAPAETQRQDKETSKAVLQDKSFEDGAGLYGSFTAEDSLGSLRSRGVPGPSHGAMLPAISGQEASQRSHGGEKGKTASGGDHEVIHTIRAAIEKAKSYPPLARKRGIEGTATTEFTINSRGYPENIRISNSSGSDILDAAAKNTVLRASPFPVVSGGIEVPITFRLER